LSRDPVADDSARHLPRTANGPQAPGPRRPAWPLPKPGELVANAYDFAEQLLAAQRKFAEDVIDATTPVLTAKNDTAAKKAAAQPK
jgi:hypothetical protein